MLDPVSYHLQHNAGEHGPVILMYHSVLPGKTQPSWPWAVSMWEFVRQLDLLSDAGWMTTTIRELVKDPQRQDPRTVVITFDDGYLDNLAACEELQRRGMRATLFVVSRSLGCEPTWPASGRPVGRLLDRTELCHLQTAGMEIGSHTASHVRLPEIDDQRLLSELSDSKISLEDQLGNEVSSFAYPYGRWDDRCEHAVRKAGYLAACTTRSGWGLRDENPYRLSRLGIFNTDTSASLARKLYFGSNDVSWPTIGRYVVKRATARLLGNRSQ